MTWKSTQGRPAFESCGPILLRQTLSRLSGIFPVSEGNTQAFSLELTATSHRSLISSTRLEASAAFRTERVMASAFDKFFICGSPDGISALRCRATEPELSLTEWPASTSRTRDCGCYPR